jgi:hypothetical protein
MREAREPRSVIQAAEKAAEAGHYASAEGLLREAARLQEASLGALHPDLANTLNNLGIVCEFTGKPIDAEKFFRRAVTIATTSLPPDHPFVTTSCKNLRDFCEARGRTVELPKPGPAVRKPKQEERESPELISRQLFGRLARGVLGPIAMLMIVLAAGLPRLGGPEMAAPSPAIPVDSPPEVTPTPPVPVPVEPIPTTDRQDLDEATSAPTPVRPTVLRARLCGEIVDWACDPADRPVPTAGPLFFYTQIKSASATTIQHRWYQGDRLHQTVKLHVQANRVPGYRTFSRNLMTSDSAGQWRIELRSEDGALLHEERFTVR